MNQRQRYLETVLFGNPDRIPFDPGGGRKSTLEAWHSQGLPKHIRPGDITVYAYRQAGGTLELPKGGPGFPVVERMIPEFEEKVVERKEDSQIVQDWKGNVCEIGLEFDVTYLRNAIDFVTRRWIKCPVESHEDWRDMRRRYEAGDNARFPKDAEQLGKTLAGRDWPVTIHVSGPYWQLREWCGFEGLSMMFYDNPALVEEMLEFWCEFIATLLEKTLGFVAPDEFHISEDMAYKGYSMLSPEMVRRFLLPVWRRWGEIVRKAGVPVYACDSDGFVGELIPLWIEADMNACDPVEVAAGNDINEFRKTFGHEMAYRGGVDKREIAKGGRHIEKEIQRIMPVIQDGGYMPSCDHGVPSDVSWPNFIHYVRLLAQATGWL